MTEQKAPVTVLGLGDMGRALAEALLDSGHSVTVWNRSTGKADHLVAKGAAEAASARAAIEASPLVIACLLDDASVYGVLTPAAEVLAGRTLVNLTTGSPDQAREMAQWAEKQDVGGFLDGGIMAVPSMIGGSDAFILYSGSASAFDQYRDTLAELGAPTFAGADPGLAALLDLALLNGMYGMFAGFLQAAAIVDTEGIPVTEFSATLLTPWLQAVIGLLPEFARQIDTGQYAAEESNLAMQTSGVGFVEFAESIGISGELMAPMQRLMEQRVDDGHGGDDLSSVFELIRKSRERKENGK
ncbi:NAD(P)-dependent oxidoreductase [Phytoactinopolyspora alkaliphila]|uniref:NAD(P)-dependent oxidoreductase n=1 Tax=Phytoactinopolyspora alkaliphila TaxID=1783498 RepID=A0A6N9YGE0_9ACTN|nr:NAD(P)-binding domain-containing protein [Phytoactinopolyspora alkaliphila]NED94076.1 NAD(P)-dependent oxidoreductase [Phytoactinopolyspora alkaliphila]